MKLTKGKISKLYNKKRQSFKRPKRKKLSNKIRTFRNKKHLNLARKTLKHYKHVGGAYHDTEAPKENMESEQEQESTEQQEPIEPTNSSIE
jgi:hypothetical protein